MIGRRKAFTLVELLVVIAIIGIFVSLLLPAVQASRESARRVTCTNQLRYLIVAVHDYELAHGHLPAGTVNPTGPILNLPNGHHISWIAHILPYIDEPALYAHLDLSLSAYHQANDRARQTTVSGLSCPSSSEAGWPFSNYAGCHHDVETPIDSDNQGVFFLNSQLTWEDLKDGAAYTLFLGEKLADEFDLGWLSGTPATLRNVGTPLNSRDRPHSEVVPSWFQPYSPADSQWSWDNSPAGAAVRPPTGATPPVDRSADGGSDVQEMAQHNRLGGNQNNPTFVGGFASRHPGGANFAMGDGAVRFISDSVSAGLMGRLANRADGQIIDANEW